MKRLLILIGVLSLSSCAIPIALAMEDLSEAQYEKCLEDKDEKTKEYTDLIANIDQEVKTYREKKMNSHASEVNNLNRAITRNESYILTLTAGTPEYQLVESILNGDKAKLQKIQSEFDIDKLTSDYKTKQLEHYNEMLVLYATEEC